MKRKELTNLGLSRRDVQDAAIDAARTAASKGWKKAGIRKRLRAAVADPEAFKDDDIFGSLANLLLGLSSDPRDGFMARDEPAPWQRWGGEDIEDEAIAQMENACRLPVAARGALMPDAHLGYGLPIGGVLATRNAVIPYAVGVDIACRMKMTVFDLPPTVIKGQSDRLKNALERETAFGLGASFRQRHEHDVLDEDWGFTELTKRLKDKAWSQLGSSGSGNHFVEFGELQVDGEANGKALGLEPGTYLALLSHSGSRGPGSAVAGHYSRLAMQLRPELPKPLKHLAWLDLDTEPGQEYWAAMELMGRFASANHAVIHSQLLKALGAKALGGIENHHNFAWREEHEVDGQVEELVVHRKGATPASMGELGVIPGTMAHPAYVVRGRGEPASLRSASHGAGRIMSRKKAKHSFTWSQTKKLLQERGVELLSAGLDEVPMAYRDIGEVMAAQTDLVDILARFTPRIVKMAPPGEKPED